MECPDFKEALSAYADGQINAREKGLLIPHLQQCPACRRRLKEFQALKKAVGRVASAQMPVDLPATLIREARKQSRRKAVFFPALPRWRPWALSLGALGFAAASIAVVVLRASFSPGQDISLDAMLAAHNEYALTMPLSPQELILSDLSMRLQ